MSFNIRVDKYYFEKKQAMRSDSYRSFTSSPQTRGRRPESASPDQPKGEKREQIPKPSLLNLNKMDNEVPDSVHEPWTPKNLAVELPEISKRKNGQISKAFGQVDFGNVKELYDEDRKRKRQESRSDLSAGHSSISAVAEQDDVPVHGTADLIPVATADVFKNDETLEFNDSLAPARRDTGGFGAAMHP